MSVSLSSVYKHAILLPISVTERDVDGGGGKKEGERKKKTQQVNWQDSLSTMGISLCFNGFSSI